MTDFVARLAIGLTQFDMTCPQFGHLLIVKIRPVSLTAWAGSLAASPRDHNALALQCRKYAET